MRVELKFKIRSPNLPVGKTQIKHSKIGLGYLKKASQGRVLRNNVGIGHQVMRKGR